MKTKLILIIFLLVFVLRPISAYSLNEQTVELAVNKGDYIIKICEKYLVQPKQCPQIIKSNRLMNPDLIYPEQKIKIPVKLLKGMPSDGLVTFVKGDAAIKHKDDAEWLPIEINHSIKEGSNIKTGRDSAVKITFEDDTTLLIKEDTLISLSASRKSLYHFFNEIFLDVGRAITNLRSVMGEGKRFDIRTPSAVTAARGTEFRTSVDRGDTTRSEVLEGSIEVSAMKQRVLMSKGEGTLVKKGSPPMTPKKLLYPPNPIKIEDIYKQMPIRLNFSIVENASLYRISLSGDREMSDTVKEGIIMPDAIFEISSIPDGLYYLQTSSIDSDGIEGFSLDPIQVKIRINPLPPFISSPVEGSEYSKKTIKFNWLKVADAGKYHLQIAKDRDFNNMIIDQNIKETEFTTSLDYHTYFFRISSIAADGYEAGWSDIQRFDIVPPPPAPQIDKPEFEKDKITIRWRSLGDRFFYHFQMSKDPSFNQVLEDKYIDTPYIILNKPGEAAIYYIRTSAIDRKGHEGEFSPPQSFEIKSGLMYKIIGVFGILGTIMLLAI